MLTRNLRLKALASALAVVTWMGVVYAGNPPETRTVLVRIPQDQGSIPAGFVLVHPIPDVAIRVAGTRDHLASFDPANLRLSVDYAVINHPGMQLLPLTVINTDHNVDLDNPPASVEADVDRLDSAAVPVSINVTSPPPRGYVISSQAVTPDRVTVVGPSQELRGIRARVDVDLGVEKANLQEEYKVFLVDRAGHQLKDVNASPSNVRVSISISANLTSRASAVVPRTVGALPANRVLTGIRVDPVTVVLYGPQDLLNALDAVPTVPISLAGVTADTSVPVRLAPPAGVSVSPDVVTVHLSVAILGTPPPPGTPPASPVPTAAPGPSPALSPGR